MWLAVRYRRLQAVMLVTLAALITGCVVLTPLYYLAMQQALTRLTVAAASSSDTAITLRSFSRFTSGVDSASFTPASREDLAKLLQPNVRSWFLPPIEGESLLVTRADLTSKSPVGELLWRDSACAHVVWTTGSCPKANGDIAISTADSKNFGLTVGSVVRVVEELTGNSAGRLPTVTLRVTGVYTQSSGEYWDDRVLTGLSGLISSQAPYRPSHDTWLTAAPTFVGAAAPRWVDPINAVTFNLDRAHADADRVLRLGPIAQSMANRTAYRVDDNGNSVNDPSFTLADLQTGLPAITATVEEGHRQALVTVPLLMIQLGLLVLFVLGLVLGAAVEQRRPEVALARLRGSGRTGARRLVLSELLPVVLVGVPVGIAGALGLAALARHTVLAGAPFELGLGFWVAIVAAVVLLAAVTWLTAAAGTRDELAAQLRSVPTRVGGWALGVTDAVVVASSVTVLIAFLTGGLKGPFALAAPALLALIVGLLLAHLIVPGSTWLGRRAMARGRYAAALAMLATARRPATRRIVTVIAVASSLLVFSTYAISVGSRNRQVASQRDVGSAMVADVSGSDVVPVQRALATVADGHETPVVRMTAAGHSFRTTLAVVPADFGRIAFPPESAAAPVPWSTLQKATGRRLALTGQRLSMVVSVDRFSGTREGAFLQLELIDSNGHQSSVDLGAIPGAGSRVANAAVSCAAGCTVEGLTVRAFVGVKYSGHVVLSRVKVAGGSTDLPGDVTDWRPGGAKLDAVAAVAGGSGTLTLQLANSGVGELGMTSSWFPVTLPALVAGPGGDPATRDVNGNGLNGDDRALVNAGSLPRAPGVDGAAAIVDLDLLTHWGTRTTKSTRIQVWFDSEDAARLARVSAALQQNGVSVVSVRRVSEVRQAYDSSVPAWSLQLGVLVAFAGLVIAALALVLLAASTFRRRSRDLACLRMSGVPRRGLERVAIGEQLPIVLLAAVAGSACGYLGAVVALPIVPIFAVARPTSTLDLSTPWLPVLVVVAIQLIVLGLVAWLCGRPVASRSQLSRVREAL